MRLRAGHQHPQFWPILARFVDNYSLFWVPGLISTIDEPRGAFTCRSSTPVVLADSGSFCGLLLTVFGPGVISMINEPWGAFMCRSSTPAVLGGSDPFHGLLHTVLRSRSDFHN